MSQKFTGLLWSIYDGTTGIIRWDCHCPTVFFDRPRTKFSANGALRTGVIKREQPEVSQSVLDISEAYMAECLTVSKAMPHLCWSYLAQKDVRGSHSR
jgi:hypothetical protein